jgi:hypothetical protein
MVITSAYRMQATGELLLETNTRISNLASTQATQAKNMSTLEKILIQQATTIQNQVELLKSFAFITNNGSSAGTLTTVSTPTSSSISSAPQPTAMEVVNSSPQTTLKRSRRLSATGTSDMVDATYHPDLNNYSRRQRSVLFTLLDNKDDFELKQTPTGGYKHMEKYRTHN